MTNFNTKFLEKRNYINYFKPIKRVSTQLNNYKLGFNARSISVYIRYKHPLIQLLTDWVEAFTANNVRDIEHFQRYVCNMLRAYGYKI